MKLCASRIAEAREPGAGCASFMPSGEIEVDFVARTFVNTHAVPAPTPISPTPRPAATPWGASVAAFLAAVRGETPPPRRHRRRSRPAPSTWPWPWRWPPATERGRRTPSPRPSQPGCDARRPLPIRALLSAGAWRSLVAHLTGGRGVAGWKILSLRPEGPSDFP